MIQDIDLRLPPQDAFDESGIINSLMRYKGLDVAAIKGIQVLKKSIDARQRHVFINLRVRVFLNEAPIPLEPEKQFYPDVSNQPTAIVVGAGPGGLFAALRLIQLGIRPLVVERGKSVHERKKDIAQITRNQKVDADSNYAFGEGGAGAFSDGKLYTRSKKRGNVERILHVLCQFGASPSVLVDAHPHIGTDKLPGIIERIREQINACGGEVRFETRMDDLLQHKNKVVGIRTQSGVELMGSVVLATGHSARDVYHLLHTKKVRMEAKGLAIGVRLEHPQGLIDQIQYHSTSGRGQYLPPAEYSYVTQIRDRGVYSFCMCPGGFVVPAASGPHQVVVNGMSPSNRGSQWANAGMVVELRPEDATNSLQNDIKGAFLALGLQPDALPTTFAPYDNRIPGALVLMQIQEQIEGLSYLYGGSSQIAPAQRMVDFVQNRLSSSLPSSSYTPGLNSSPLHAWLPTSLTGRLKEGFNQFDRSNRGFMTSQALMLGVETRTSSPVRILRNPDSLTHVDLEDLYPCGEGSGYAGGIVSAAIDGERCAEQLAEKVLFSLPSQSIPNR